MLSGRDVFGQLCVVAFSVASTLVSAFLSASFALTPSKGILSISLSTVSRASCVFLRLSWAFFLLAAWALSALSMNFVAASRYFSASKGVFLANPQLLLGCFQLPIYAHEIEPPETGTDRKSYVNVQDIGHW